MSYYKDLSPDFLTNCPYSPDGTIFVIAPAPINENPKPVYQKKSDESGN